MTDTDRIHARAWRASLLVFALLALGLLACVNTPPLTPTATPEPTPTVTATSAPPYMTPLTPTAIAGMGTTQAPVIAVTPLGGD